MNADRPPNLNPRLNGKASRPRVEKTAFMVGNGNDQFTQLWCDGAARYGWENVQHLPVLRPHHPRLVLIFPDEQTFQKASKALHGTDKECVVVVQRGYYRNDEKWLTLTCVPPSDHDGLNLAIGTGQEGHMFMQYALSSLEHSLADIRSIVLGLNMHVPSTYPPRASFIDTKETIRRIRLCDAYDFSPPELALRRENVLVVAAHIESTQYLQVLEARLAIIVAAFRYTHVIIVYSSSYEVGSILHLDIGAPITPLVDKLNTTRDAGKYYLAAKAVKTSDGQAPNKLTFINDAFYLLPDVRLEDCASRTIALENDHALVGMVSSSSPSYHLQSWWLSFTLPSAMDDFLTLLSMMRLPVNASSTIELGAIPWPVIDQMEVCGIQYLTRKYKSAAVYPAHLITPLNIMGLETKASTLAFQYLLDSGFPFFKRSTIRACLLRQNDFPSDISEILKSGHEGKLI